MAAQITFRGSTLLDAGEGGYQFPNPPVFGKRDKMIVKLARSVGGLSKDLGAGPVPFNLELFMPTATASVAGIRSRMVGFCSNGSGSLVIPDYGTFTHCELVDVQEGPQKKIVKQDGTAGYLLRFALTFVKLRA